MSRRDEAVEAYGEFYRHSVRPLEAIWGGGWTRIVEAKEYPVNGNARWVVIAGNGEPVSFRTRDQAEQDAERIIARRCQADLEKRSATGGA